MHRRVRGSAGDNTAREGLSFSRALFSRRAQLKCKWIFNIRAEKASPWALTLRGIPVYEFLLSQPRRIRVQGPELQHQMCHSEKLGLTLGVILHFSGNALTCYTHEAQFDAETIRFSSGRR